MHGRRNSSLLKGTSKTACREIEVSDGVLKSFPVAAESAEQGILADVSSSSDVALVAFGGIAGGIGIPVFEFATLTSRFPVKRLFLRDLKQAWYHLGVEGVGDSIDQVAAWLRVVLDEQGVERVVMVGNSSGGFAALLFGGLLGVAEVHAFSPQTFISGTLRWFYRDTRWKEQISRIKQAEASGRRYFDLKSFLSARKSETVYHIHFCSAHRLDTRHAERMKDVANVCLNRYQYGAHELVKQLKHEGALEELLASALREER
jgi:pimeloyl-ACP methyl ester carboxylesterase